MKPSGSQYGKNLLKLLRGNQLLEPVAATFYVTTRCNLNCTYCEDFGARRNAKQPPFLSLDDAQHILRVIRSGTDSVILTGGEPLLHPDIVALVTFAKTALNFKHITMLTNGLMLPNYEALLPQVDRLVISLDSIDPDYWSTIIDMPCQTAQTILDNIQRTATLQQQYDFRLVLNCVISPETLPGAPAILDFCQEHNLLVSFSPQAVDDWPRYELLVSEEYKAFVAQLIESKKNGGPILGSDAYLQSLYDFTSYACYPTLVPRIMADGALVYPCRPIERKGASNGGRPVNLLDVDSWAEAMETAVSQYGSPPQHCTSCFQQCFAEPSLMQSRPLAHAIEWLRYPASRQAKLYKHAPG
jgi:MoaA/NifB/PqqE/SkfB family radical SAM enzyme